MTESRQTLRVLYLAYEHKEGDQRGRIRVFRDMLANGRLAALEIFSYKMIANLQGWPQMWQRLLEVANKFQPTAIYWQHMVSGEIDEQALQKIKSIASRPMLVSETGDAFGNFWIKPFSRVLLRAAQLSDATFLSGLGRQKTFLEKRGARNVLLLPHGLDEGDFGQPFKGTYEPCYDVAMIANRISSRKPFGEMPGQRLRKDLIRRLIAEFGDGFALYGNGWDQYPVAKGPVSFFDQDKVYRESRLGIGNANFLDIEYYESNRPFIAIASGVPYISMYVPGMDRMLVDGEHCFYYRNNAEAIHVIKQQLQLSDEQRLTFGASAAQFVREKHSLARRMETLITTIERLREAKMEGRDSFQPVEDFFIKPASSAKAA